MTLSVLLAILSASSLYLFLALSAWAGPRWIPHYGFARFEQNRIQFPAGESRDFNLFLRKLDTLRVTGRGDVRILHVGGSHVQGGTWTDQLRQDFLSLGYGLDGGRGLVFSSRRPADLGAKLGLSDAAAARLQETMETWSGEYCRTGEDGAYQRKLDDLLSDLSRGPWYGFYVSPGVLQCLGGVRTDARARVLGMDGTPIPGLYAAGEVTGGVHGASCLPGDSLADALVFGLRAADSAIRGE